MTLRNYHTHSTFCDGGNSMEEMVQAAIAAGGVELGFSGHSYLAFDKDWTMSPESTIQYRQEFYRLKEKYASAISLRLGVEQDICSSTEDLDAYEYVIGAVHCLFKDENYISVDYSAETLKKAIDELYAGDPYALVEDYYEAVSTIYEKTHCQIIAHFDLITKFIERGIGIDPAHPRYVAASDKALDHLLAFPVAFEINTGAISRGYRHDPYPDERILSRLHDAGAQVILSSDTHAVDTIFYDFDNAERLVEKYHLNCVSSIDDLL